MPQNRLAWRPLSVISLLAGIVYSSWVLGPILNPLVARRGMASELAVTGQPYYWIFLYGDVVCSLLMLIVIYLLKRQVKTLELSDKYSLAGMLMFCITAAAAALCPVQCVSALRQCPSFTHNPFTLIHAITSVMAGLGLWIAVIGLARRKPFNKLFAAQLALFSLIGACGIAALLVPGKYLFVQNVFITLCSVFIAAYPWEFWLAKNAP